MTIHQRFFSRPRLWSLLCGLTLAVAQLFIGAGMGTVQAATTNCTPNGATQTCTVTFAYSGAAETWNVPGSVTSVTVDLSGGKGGDGFGGVGGKGAHVYAVLPVTGGETLGIVVAGQGGEGHAFGGGGGSSSGPGFFTNGGGGASHVERNGVRLLVAGGGGGAGTAGGIAGGDSGNPGVTYSGFGEGVYDAHGGGAGTASAGGAGGAGGVGLAASSCGSWTDGAPGSDGGLGQGGDGGAYAGRGGAGGGGGGGYYGGGGGGSSALCNTLSVVGRPGGGGGGSSYIVPSATQGSITEGVQNGPGQVILSYIVTDNTAPSASPTQSPEANTAGWNNTDVTVTWNWTDDPDGKGIDQGNCIQSSASNGEGEQLLTATCKDLAGNEGYAEHTVNVDKTAPVVTVDNVSDGASYTLGSVPISGCSTDDALSGVAIPAAFNRSGGNPDGTGSFTITCSGAVDNAGNSGSASVSYTVTAGGTLVGVCGGYEVRQTDNSYTAAGWSGAIKVGTNGKNTLTGTSGPDLMLGLGGNDKLDGKGGDDILCGGDGVDLLLGMAGNDYLDGGNGNDVLNGGSGDYDQLLAGEGNDTLLDGDGVSNAQGGPGNELFALALRKGWRDTNGQTQFVGRLAAGYGNDTVILVILDRNAFFVDVTGDERDDPASPAEGNDDRLGLLGNLSPAPVRLKFEKQLVISAEAEGIVDEEAGAEYLTEPVGEEAGTADLNNRLFLPLINR